MKNMEQDIEIFIPHFSVLLSEKAVPWCVHPLQQL